MDLFIRNFPYFMETYFNVSWVEAIICWIIIFGICIHFTSKLYDRKNILWNTLLAAILTGIIIVSLLNQSRSRVRMVILNPYEAVNAVRNGNIHMFRQMISNIILYIPFGIILTIILGRSKKVVVYMGVLLSVCVEVLQYVLARGYSESMDIICNTLGDLLGIGIVYGCRKIFFQIEKRRRRKDA